MEETESRDFDGHLLIEFTTIGAYVKVSAVDPASGEEVSLVGDAAASRDQLAKLAARKLRYVTGRRGRNTQD